MATAYEYGRTPEQGQGIMGLLDFFTPLRRPVISPGDTRYEEIDGAMYPVETVPGEYGDPEFGFSYMPAVQAVSGLLSDPVGAAKAVPGAMAGQIEDYATASLGALEGGYEGMITPEGEPIEASPILPIEYLLGGGIAALRQPGVTLGAAGGKLTKAEKDPLGYGAIAFDRPVSEIDVRVDAPSTPNLPRIYRSIEDFQGSILMPVYWDKSSNRGLLTGIDEIDLPNRVLLEGGPDFMVGPASQAEGAILASGQSVVSGLTNRAAQLAEETGRDVLGATITMAPDAVDFTTFMSRALAEQIPISKISKKDKKSFDEEMLKVDKNWPGVDAPNLPDYLASVKSGIRKAFVRNMDKKPVRDAGFPSVGKTRVAVTEPDLLDVPAGQAGFAIGQFDLNAPLILNPRVPHETYPVQAKGIYRGGLRRTYPQGLLFRDAYRGMEGRTFINQKGVEVPFNEANKTYTLKTQLPGQIVDQELVDTIMEYDRSLLGK